MQHRGPARRRNGPRRSRQLVWVLLGTTPLIAWHLAGLTAPAGAAPSPDPAAQLFVDQCSACHTIGGGKLVGLDLAEVATWPDENLRKGVKSMEDYVGALSDEQVQQLVEFLKDPKNKERVAAAEARAAPAAPAPATPAPGEKPAVKPATPPTKKPPAAKPPAPTGAGGVPTPGAPSITPAPTAPPIGAAPAEQPAPVVTAPTAPPLNATPLPSIERQHALPFGRLEIAVLILGFVVLIAAFIIVTDTVIGSARAPGGVSADALLTARRHLLKGMFGVVGAAILMSLGVFDKLLRFYQGPRATPDEQTEFLDRTLQRSRLTEAQQALELERLRQDYIFVARLGDLKPSQGLYFIDYALRPAMAFRGADGLPWLLSAKCTHLGCTVKASVNAQGQLGCPCHFSLFDVRTGVPTPQSVAKAPLPVLGWVLMDDQGAVVASRTEAGEMNGKPDPAKLDSYRVFIAKRFAEDLV